MTDTPAPMTAEEVERILDVPKLRGSDGRWFVALYADKREALRGHIDAQDARIAELECELNARKPPEEGEVAVAIEAILKCELTRDEAHAAADLLTRLSAALKEAERRERANLDNAMRMADIAEKAEAKLETARGSHITKTTKPGKACYCDAACTPEQCSDDHNHREVMIELF